MFPGKKTVLPPLSSDPSLRPGASSEDGPPQKLMTLDVKAKTLGYQLPRAEAEIQRIEEFQKSKRDELLKRRQGRVGDRASDVANWLDRHADSTLRDLALATSEVPVRSVMMPTAKEITQLQSHQQHQRQQNLQPDAEEKPFTEKLTMEELFALEDEAQRKLAEDEASQRDGLGVSRYQVRGDLKKWLTRVEALNERLLLDAGDFSKDEEQLIHASLAKHVSKTVNRDVATNEFLMKQSLKCLCEMLENLTRAPFAVIEDMPVREQLASFEHQVQEFYAKAIKRGGLVFGAQVSAQDGVGGKRVESEGEIRKRQLAVGVAAAAQSQHILLTNVQLDQVLSAFYQQQLPSTKREKGRLERQLVQSMVREENVTAALRRRNKDLAEEIEAMRETVQQLLVERNAMAQKASLIPTSTTAGGTTAEVQQDNEVIREMADVLAKKAIREMQSSLAAAQKEVDDLRTENARLKGECADATASRDDYCARLLAAERRWEAQEEAKRQQDEERKRLFGGMKSDQQYYQSTIHKLLMKTTAALGELVLCVQPHSDEVAMWTRLLEVLQQWSSGVSFAFHFAESCRATIQSVQRSCEEQRSMAEARRACADPARTTLSGGSLVAGAMDRDAAEVTDIHRQLMNTLAQRLDETVAESKAKFRESRYMRNFLWYLIHCFEAMLNGTYSDEVHGKRKFAATLAQGKDADNSSSGVRGAHANVEGPEDSDVVDEPFPPERIVAPDTDYAYAWTEESQALERVFLGFRARLGSAEAQQGEVNSAVLRALEAVGSGDRIDASKKNERANPATGGTGVTEGAERNNPAAVQHAARVPGASSWSANEVQGVVDEISNLPIASTKDVRLAQTLEDHQRLPSGARAVDVATVLLLQIKEAKRHFQGNCDTE